MYKRMTALPLLPVFRSCLVWLLLGSCISVVSAEEDFKKPRASAKAKTGATKNLEDKAGTCAYVRLPDAVSAVPMSGSVARE